MSNKCKRFNGCGRTGLLTVALEKNTAPSVLLKAYGCVFIIETTYPEAHVACIGEEKKEGKIPRLSFQWQVASLLPAKPDVSSFRVLYGRGCTSAKKVAWCLLHQS